MGYKNKDIDWVVRLPRFLQPIIKERAEKEGKKQVQILKEAVVSYVNK